MKLFTGISQLAQPRSDTCEIDTLPDGALLVDGDDIVAAGPREAVLAHPGAREAERYDLGGRAVVPGFVDSHTHTVFAGDRVDEMARRARGETYEQIAAAGGGIARSATLLAQTSIDDIVAASLKRARFMLQRGTTTLEVKSGYGLMPAMEEKHLQAIYAFSEQASQRVVSTVLAHVVPKSFESREAYVKAFCEEIMPKASREFGVMACDVFVDRGAFTAAEARTIAAEAQKQGLCLKLHVDQLRLDGGAELAAELGAVSADHLEYTEFNGMQALAKAGVVATILPGCRMFLGKGPWPQARALRDAGCHVAIATDCNPGSSHIFDLAMCGTLAVTQCGLTLDEALWGITRGGAEALAMGDRGCLRAGELADFVVLDHADWRALFYSPGAAPIGAVYIGGEEQQLRA